MNLLFLVPSLGYGLVLFVTTGNALLLWLSLATMVVWLIYSNNKAFDLTQEVRFEGDRVWIGERRLPISPLLWGNKIRNLVYAKAFPAEVPELEPEVFDRAIGVMDSGVEITQPISPAAPHAIVIGPTGSGKTELMRLIASQFRGSVWIIDFKGGSGFADFRKAERLVSGANLDQLAEFTLELEQRQSRILSKPLLIVVDELAEVLKVQPFAVFLESLAAKGRSLNMYLLAANQTLSQVPRTIWVNCANRFSVGADLIDRSQLGFSSKPPEPLHPQGNAELLTKSAQLAFGFPFGYRPKREDPASLETGNPLLLRVASRPQ